jgi:hypothetical protein
MKTNEHKFCIQECAVIKLFQICKAKRLALDFIAIVVVALSLAVTGCCSWRPDHSISDALNSNDPQTWVETSFKVRGRDYRLCLPVDLTDSAPAWNAQGGKNPRLLPAKVVVLARMALAKTFTDAAGWSLDSIEIREIPILDPFSGLPVSTGKWYYEVCFRPPGDGLRTRGPHETLADVYKIFVLMNGVVIEPKPDAKVE